MDPSAPATSTATSYLDWSDKGTATFVRYAIGLILILASWLVLGGMVAVPFTLLGLTVLEGSAAGKTLGLVSSFFVAAVAVPLVTRYLLGRPWWSFGFPQRRIDWRAVAKATTRRCFGPAKISPACGPSSSRPAAR